MYKEIDRCRICGSTDLALVLDLGMQYLTGVFPRQKSQKIIAGPLELVKCSEEADGCGLLQLRHSYDLTEMYGLNYGYRPGLNHSMVNHLHRKVKKLLDMVSLASGDLVINIGSNDSTPLQVYPAKAFELVGIDPTGKKFSKYYPEHIRLIEKKEYINNRGELQFPLLSLETVGELTPADRSSQEVRDSL